MRCVRLSILAAIISFVVIARVQPLKVAFQTLVAYDLTQVRYFALQFLRFFLMP